VLLLCALCAGLLLHGRHVEGVEVGLALQPRCTAALQGELGDHVLPALYGGSCMPAQAGQEVQDGKAGNNACSTGGVGGAGQLVSTVAIRAAEGAAGTLIAISVSIV